MSGALYLDYAATAPLDPAVAAEMAHCLSAAGDFANPSASHAPGRAAAQRIGRDRALVAELVGASAAQIVFTSGATESNNLAVLGAVRAARAGARHVVTARTEHKSVLDPCRRLEREGCQVTWLTPGADGVVTAQAVAAALRRETVLVSLMHANNETGVLQDIAAVGALCRERGVLLHSDCVQSVGRVPVDMARLGVDFASFTAHKLCGPKGVGALYLRSGARAHLQPLMFGGGQEGELRPGTLPTHQIAGFALACKLARDALAGEGPRLAALGAMLWQRLAVLGGVHLNGAGAQRVPGIVNVSFEDVDGESLLARLPRLALSTGAACDADSADASYVLRALGRDSRLAGSSLRFSMGRFTTSEEVEEAAGDVIAAAHALRRRSPRRDPAEVLVREATGPSGPAGPGQARTLVGEAGGPAADVWVRFLVEMHGDTVKDARAQVLGCPHTMDVADWLCGTLKGRRAAVVGTPADWARERAVPVEKLGRLLVIEDALRACFRANGALKNGSGPLSGMD